MIYITWQKNISDISQWETPERVLTDRGSGLITIISSNDNSTIATIQNEINLSSLDLWSIRKLSQEEIETLP